MQSSEPRRQQIRAIKGTRDILPPESALWNRVEQTARDVFATYAFGEIRLPIFEQTELFARSVGADTDIVAKEMYTFKDRPSDLPPPKSLDDYGAHVDQVESLMVQGSIPRTETNLKTIVECRKRIATISTRIKAKEDVEGTAKLIIELYFLVESWDLGNAISLRPEATASVCRAYIEHGLHTWPGDVKLYYIGPMFRRERPQKGRYRQFYQIGAEVLGQSDAPAIDAEVIEMLMSFFTRVGLTGCTLFVNSIGCPNCRPQYIETLRAALTKIKDQLGPDSQRRIDTNPLRVLDSKLESEQPLIEKLPRITDHLCQACREHFAQLEAQLNLRGIAYQHNWRLVRGLDYYMRTTFEITAPGLGSQNAVCGGGRYDGLVELLGGQPTKGIGFAIGTDRLILSLQESAATAARSLDAYIVWMGAATHPAALKLARRLRDAGLSIEIPPEETKIKKALSLADKLGARFAIIIGENEVSSGTFTVKRLADSSQQSLGEKALLDFLKA